MKKAALILLILVLCLTGCAKKPVEEDLEKQDDSEKQEESTNSYLCGSLKDPKRNIRKNGTKINENEYRIIVNSEKDAEYTSYLCNFDYCWFIQEASQSEEQMIYDWATDSINYQNKIYDFQNPDSYIPPVCQQLRETALNYLTSSYDTEIKEEGKKSCVIALNRYWNREYGKRIEPKLRIINRWYREKHFQYSIPVWNDENAKYVCDFMGTTFRYESNTLEDTIVYNWGKDNATYQGETYRFLDTGDEKIPQPCKDLRIMALWYLNLDVEIDVRTGWDGYVAALREYATRFMKTKPEFLDNIKEALLSNGQWKEDKAGVLSLHQGNYNCYFLFDMNALTFSWYPEDSFEWGYVYDIQNNTLEHIEEGYESKCVFDIRQPNRPVCTSKPKTYSRIYDLERQTITAYGYLSESSGSVSLHMIKEFEDLVLNQVLKKELLYAISFENRLSRINALAEYIDEMNH